MRQARRRWLAAGCALAMAAPASGQSAQQPTFRSGLSLAALDVTVVDPRGNPVMNLGPDDFVVTVDGKPRTVRAATALGSAAPEAGARDTRARGAVTNTAGGDEGSATGDVRLVVFLFDDLSFGPLEGRGLAQAAARFAARLPARDFAAALTTSGIGSQVGPTLNRTPVTEALGNFIGHRRLNSAERFNIAVTEAFAIEDGDVRLLAEVVARECVDDPSRVCALRVEAAARNLSIATKEQSRQQLAQVLAVLGSLKGAPGGFQVIYLTRGIVTLRGETPFVELQRLAAANNITLFVLQSPAALVDLAVRDAPVRASEDRALERQGLDEVAGAIDGTVLQVVGTADRHFETLERQLNALYRVGFELTPEDETLRAREVEITIARGGFRVLPSRRLIVLGKPRASTSVAAAPEARLQALLADPAPSTAIPITARAFVARDPSGQGLLLTLAGSARVDGPARAAFALVSPGGSRLTSAETPGAIVPQSGVVSLGFKTIVPPGDYVLRLAVLSDAGEAGSLSYPFRARLTQAGAVALADPVLWTGSADTPVYSAGATLTTGTGIHARVEVYPGTSAPVESHALVLRVIAAPGGAAVITTRVPLVVGPDGTSASGWLPVDDMVTGDYVLRTTVERDGVEAGAIEQPFRLEKIAPPPPGAGAAPAAPSGAAPAFDAAAWLAEGGMTAITGAFGRAGIALSDKTLAQLSRPAGIERNPPPTPEGLLLRAVLALTERRFDAASGAVAALDRRLAGSPAPLVLTGALFAARGFDREAIGAWQTAETAGAGDPAIAAAIVDALRRLGATADADARLKDALARWPSDSALKRRIR